MSTDDLTTLAGGLTGAALLLSAFGILQHEQAQAVREAAPLIAEALGVVVLGYFANKR